MSYVNGTTHYNLPQTIGTDTRDWSDTNKAFADIDAAIYNASETANGLVTRVTTNEKNIEQLTTDQAKNTADIAAQNGRITTTENGLANANTNIADVRSDLEDMVTAYNEATATASRNYKVDEFLIYNDVLYRVTNPITAGGTIVPNTNVFATNVGTELRKLVTERMVVIKYPAISNVTAVQLLNQNSSSILSALNAVYSVNPGLLAECCLIEQSSGQDLRGSGSDVIYRPMIFNWGTSTEVDFVRTGLSYNTDSGDSSNWVFISQRWQINASSVTFGRIAYFSNTSQWGFRLRDTTSAFSNEFDNSDFYLVLPNLHA